MAVAVVVIVVVVIVVVVMVVTVMVASQAGCHTATESYAGDWTMCGNLGPERHPWSRDHVDTCRRHGG